MNSPALDAFWNQIYFRYDGTYHCSLYLKYNRILEVHISDKVDLQFNPNCPGGVVWCHPAYLFRRCDLTDKAVNLKFHDFSSNFIWNLLQKIFFNVSASFRSVACLSWTAQFWQISWARMFIPILPKYDWLSRCVVIISRLGSRIELQKHILAIESFKILSQSLKA